MSMTAHPKVDPETGEAFAFRYHVVRPYDPPRIDVTVKNNKICQFSPCDYIIDPRYSRHEKLPNIPDSRIVMSLTEITKGRPPVRVDSTKVPRVGIIRKYAKDESELLWIEAMGFNMMHCFNSWEEDDGEKIVMLVSNISSIEHALERIDLAMPRLEKVVINIKAKTLERHSLSDKALDMGSINPNYAGKQSRYAYVGIVAQPMKLVGVVKIDLSMPDSASRAVASRLFGPSCSGSEPFFVPKEPIIQMRKKTTAI
ncbi:hypothetical protein DH2020_036598 [Rehmannia glutinosa]|uniref:Uncharacterized protein n=1 Tax=Rehmannia glutinosa TaxID=99300 RepID=A0ABR0V5S6_REHGL